MVSKHRRSRSMAFATAVILASASSWAATINGTVTYEGKVPNLKPLAMDADPACAKKHSGAVPNEALVLGPGNTMGNILVRVVKGLPAGKSWPAPKDPVVMDQDGCQYKPHVMGIMVGQTFKVLNSDGVLHNVHSLSKTNKSFNMAMPGNRKEATHVFEKEEGVFQIKCDVHPWMSSYVAVTTHPFFAVTKPDGKFSIAGLDAGTYEIEAWHEKLGTQKSTVTVGGTETKAANFKFTAPAGK